MSKQTHHPWWGTLLGGLAFLVPFMLVFMLAGKAFSLSMAIAKPLSEILPIQTVAGVAFVNILAILLLFLACYLAGLIARLAIGRSFVERLESKLELVYPRYSVIKLKLQDLRSHAAMDEAKVVLVRFDDNAAIGFEVERQDAPEGLVTIFLPGAPDPWAGTVVYMTPDRVDPLPAHVHGVAKRMKSIGKGTGAIVAGCATTSHQPPSENNRPAEEK